MVTRWMLSSRHHTLHILENKKGLSLPVSPTYSREDFSVKLLPNNPLALDWLELFHMPSLNQLLVKRSENPSVAETAAEKPLRQ